MTFAVIPAAGKSPHGPAQAWLPLGEAIRNL